MNLRIYSLWSAWKYLKLVKVDEYGRVLSEDKLLFLFSFKRKSDDIILLCSTKVLKTMIWPPDKALLTGVNFIATYRPDYAKGDRIPYVYYFVKFIYSYHNHTIDKFILDAKNILKAACSYWSANRKPFFETFEETLYQTVVFGDYVFSGKMLSSTPMDEDR